MTSAWEIHLGGMSVAVPEIHDATFPHELRRDDVEFGRGVSPVLVTVHAEAA